MCMSLIHLKPRSLLFKLLSLFEFYLFILCVVNRCARVIIVTICNQVRVKIRFSLFFIPLVIPRAVSVCMKRPTKSSVIVTNNPN
jgi:hypothetical protein